MEKERKSMLLANFCFTDKTKKFLDYIDNKLNIPKCEVFIYHIENADKYLVTFKFEKEKEEDFDFKKRLSNAIPIHKKGEAYYTINALNRLIEINNDVEVGNVDYSSFEVDWEKYQNTLLLIEKGELVTYNITRIF